MYKFHITGYQGLCKNDYQYSDEYPVDVTVFADRLNHAIDKAENILGMYISTAYRKIVIEEVMPTTEAED